MTNDNFEYTKKLLREEPKAKVSGVNEDDIVVTPFANGEDMIVLQLGGWCLNLKSDGTWFWESTDGA